MKRIVGYTTGTFDMFHIGHLNLLLRARQLCDYLIVGVSTDEVVESYKHKRPIIPFEHRIAIVSALRCVDEVVPQTTMDKMVALKALHFDVMFHGDEWKGSELYNRYEREFEAFGGVKIHYLPHTEGISSTILRDLLNQHHENKPAEFT